MTNGRFIQRQRTLLQELKALASRRAQAETDTEREYLNTQTDAERLYEDTRRAVNQRYKADTSAAESMHRQTTSQIKSTSQSEYDNTELAFQAEREQINDKADRNEQEAKSKWDEAVWVTETVYEANETRPAQKFRRAEEKLDDRREELLDMSKQALKLVRKYRQKQPTVKMPEEEPPTDASPFYQQLKRHVEAAETHLAMLSRLRVPRLFRGFLLPFQIFLILVVVGSVTVWLNHWQANHWLAIAVGGALALLLMVVYLLYTIAKRHVVVAYRPFHVEIQSGLETCDQCLAAAQRERTDKEMQMVEERDREVAAAEEKYEPIIEEIIQRRQGHLQRIEGKYPKMLEDILTRREEELTSAEERHHTRMAELTQQYEQDARDAEIKRDEQMLNRESRHEENWHGLQREWKEGMAACFAAIDEIQGQDADLFPDWDAPSWDGWGPPTKFSPSVRFGRLEVDRTEIPGGITEDERLLVEGPTEFTLPATLDFPDACSLLLLTHGEGREQAVETLQTTMLRLLTSLPPGKVRFTIIDPVGLGQNFAGFMHLADYEESFVTGRIWTETRHIEQRLANLTEHMETVIQKYLRNEFETIADYNEHAGEIAEPYRFLVVSDFPANFSDIAARRLASIVASGARCGVYTLLTVDRRKPVPQGIEITDLQKYSNTLIYRNGTFVWKDPDFDRLPLTLEKPPSDDFVTSKLHLVGEAAKDATRVEVPFDVIAPPSDGYWTGDCTTYLSVPLGRSGATKLQQLQIGEGTSQHTLIAGKTGSGKSTLLHVLITNLALWYSPDEVQFYLVDFKKGVEFKTYANHNLPHARAVAVETDREFGLSVLRRVDIELKRRGDRFRELGVQDLAGYRRLGLDEPMPRTLLIIDEFQEMFVEDDKLGQDATLLLDRLVRQGRAFGIHVLLGSQTLGGAYTLARSTIGQMQVRIALQCAEADSYLIMSDDNSAARLLARPGEAIYNDAGGAIEGNSPFQIVWLPDSERENQLNLVQRLAEERGYRRSEPQIVFEGNVAAEIAGNHLLEELIKREDWPDDGGPPRAWLGDAIAIKDPTSAVLRRQSGNNLLMVGQREEAALAMTATAMMSLAAQRQPSADGASFTLLDGTPADSPNAGYLKRVISYIPHEIHDVNWRDIDEVMAKLAEELQRRQQDDATDAPPIYLFIYGLQRFRMLRCTDDFGFSMNDEDKPPAPDRYFADIIRDGPPFGMHTIAWCDTVTNLIRTLERNGVSEFEQRVLFQMSAPDSTQLIDSPQAGQLGLRRALFYNEEEGVLEKFRPYALPEEEWLRDVRDRFAAKLGESSSLQTPPEMGKP